MTSSVDAEKLRRCEHESRNLKETVDLLRRRVETVQRQGEHALRREIGRGQGEILQLRTTIQKLRGDLEAVHTNSQDAARQAVAEIGDETQYLKATVNALREQLERARFQRDESIPKEVAPEEADFRETGPRLPHRRPPNQRSDRIPDDIGRLALRRLESERNELRQTVSRMREQLDHINTCHETMVRSMESTHRSQCRQLEETIRVLRGRLQETSGADR